MGCCGGGHHHDSRNVQEKGLHHHTDRPNGKTNLMFLAGGLLLLGLITVFFVK